VVTLDGVRYYHTGDSDLTPEMQAVKADVLLVPVGGTYTMTAAEAARAARAIAPRLAVPMHWGDIVGERADAEAFQREAGVPVRILDPGR
jgi:L-ascorbate metabolism protein UlaG (beta-lactamase superfamily)